MKKLKIPSPKRGASVKEKLDFYNKLIEDGLDIDQLKVVRQRLYKVDTYFQDSEVIMQKITILQCLNEMISEG